jgi:hypothetical protein
VVILDLVKAESDATLAFMKSQAPLVGLFGLALLISTACGDDTGSPSDEPTAGTGGSGGGTHQGGAPPSGGFGGIATGGSAPAGAGGAAGGGNAGAAGGGTGTEIIGVNLGLGLCDPQCELYEHCVIEEVSCDEKPCLVRAVCKERPLCQYIDQSLRQNCPSESVQCSGTDPRDEDCVGTECNGICLCRDPGCAGQGLVMDWRPEVCDCAEPWGEERESQSCSRIPCTELYGLGTTSACRIILGEPMCISN